MSESEESPAQRQARIRREKREAKIRAGGNDRLDKISQLSGRAPEQRQTDPPSRASPSPSPTPQPAAPSMFQSADPAQVRAQEEFLRSMLRARESQQGQSANQAQQQMPEDPMMKLLSSLTGAEGSADPQNPARPSLSPEDIQNATGMPAWATSMLTGGKKEVPPSQAQKTTATGWNLLHLVFSVLAGVYFLFVLEAATAEFGKDPPPPATIKDPFLLFVLGELLIHGSRALLGRSSANTLTGSLRIAKDICRDGSIVLFMLGAASWWKGTAR